jgi:transposase
LTSTEKFSHYEKITYWCSDETRFGLHTAKKLQIPSNIIVLFQPPYSPELNPIERLWQALKKDLKWELFSTLNELHLFLDRIVKELTPEFIASVCGYPFILNALSVANIY